MSHSYISCRMDYVFSTKNRQPFITPELAARLWPYMGGIANANHIIPFAIGGIENHIHAGLPDKKGTADSASACPMWCGRCGIFNSRRSIIRGCLLKRNFWPF